MSEETPPTGGAPRRNFLTAVGAVVVAGLSGLTPLIASVSALLDPLRRRGGTEGMVMVAKLSVVPDDGVPRKFTVQSDRVDAWTTYRNTPVGAVYLRRAQGGDVACLNVVCPHAGCFVNVAPDGSRFACPCHRSSFDLEGHINDPASPSPRDMDALDVEVRNGDEVWVRFENFLPGQKDRVPVI